MISRKHLKELLDALADHFKIFVIGTLAAFFNPASLIQF